MRRRDAGVDYNLSVLVKGPKPLCYSVANLAVSIRPDKLLINRGISTVPHDALSSRHANNVIVKLNINCDIIIS